jgi:hypothetical protein
MAFLDSIIKVKKPGAAAPAPSGPPVDQVVSMQQKNMTNNQIVESLQRQGYDINTIMDAIAQAEVMGGVQPLPMTSPGPALPPMPPPPAPAPQESTPAAEEIAEKIVEEKWQQVDALLKTWQEWRDMLNTRVERLEQALQDTRADLDNLHKAIVAKIGDYDKNLMDVGTELKAMEKVFQKVLPTLTENVSELGRITQKIKEK